ncbi:MAG: hypothetical protein EOP14_07860 [Pseudomonas sp.]|nr:MAG: hypothetical protein EOP14_07860 [Pseudomonas sp.]
MSSQPEKHDYLVLRCINKIKTELGTSVDYDLHVLTPKAVPVQHYEMMCAVICACPLHILELGIEKIFLIERHEIQQSSIGIDAIAAIFDATKATFWCEFGFNENYVDDGNGEEGGEVTLAQFKLAVQTYLQFLHDPERKPIEVPFPPT